MSAKLTEYLRRQQAERRAEQDRQLAISRARKQQMKIREELEHGNQEDNS